MQNTQRFKRISFFLAISYLLAACGGTLPRPTISAQVSKEETNLVAFTGIVEAINGTEWKVGGQTLTLDPQVSLDPNIAVGDTVRVEANVFGNGAVVAFSIETPDNDNVVSTPLSDTSGSLSPLITPSPNLSLSPTVPNASSTLVTSVPDARQLASPNESVNEIEVFGVVEAMTANMIKVDGVAYNLTTFTEFKDAVTVGDPVKLHVLVNSAGTLTIREIEKSDISFDDNNDNNSGSDNSDDNSNSGDDNENDDSNGDNSGSGGNSGSSGD